MIKEFAIEPCVLANWGHFQALFDDFGVGKGRLIARYPRDWPKDVQKHVVRLEREGKLGPIKAKTIVEKIFAHKYKFIQAGRSYEPSRRWLDNAEAELHPFDTIIAHANPRTKPTVLVADDLDKDGALYFAQTQTKVPRKANALADCAQLLLRSCQDVQLVDPHFDATARRFKETFLEILSRVTRGQRKLRSCEIHTARFRKQRGVPQEFNPSNQSEHYRRAFEREIPVGTDLRVFFWDEKPTGERLHARFLLTELGGLQYDYGTDAGKDGEKTIVTLMDNNLWQMVRTDYCENGEAFSITPENILRIPGKRTTLNR